MVLRTRLFESQFAACVFSLFILTLCCVDLDTTLLGALLMVCCFAVTIMMFVKF